MQSVAHHFPGASKDRADIPVFRVVIVYEDFTTARRAKQAYDFLAANLTHEWQVTSQMWKFGLLRIPEIRAMAAEDVMLADLIIVSCKGDGELPADVKDWIEMWQGDKGEPVGLIVLFDRPPEQAEHASATQTYLERVAKRRRMEFFTWPDVGLAEQHWWGNLDLDHRAEMPGGPLLPPVVVEPREARYSRQGISE